jgi:hypothetical protein
MSAYDTLTILVAVAGVVFGGGVLTQVITHVRKQILRDAKMDDVSDAVLGEHGIARRMIAIEAELRPNSGASLRDAVNRIATLEQTARSS